QTGWPVEPRAAPQAPACEADGRAGQRAAPGRADQPPEPRAAGGVRAGAGRLPRSDPGGLTRSLVHRAVRRASLGATRRSPDPARRRTRARRGGDAGALSPSAGGQKSGGVAYSPSRKQAMTVLLVLLTACSQSRPSTRTNGSQSAQSGSRGTAADASPIPAVAASPIPAASSSSALSVPLRSGEYVVVANRDDHTLSIVP